MTYFFILLLSKKHIFSSSVYFQNPVSPYLLTGEEAYSSINNSDGLTLVSAYFDVGTFITGDVTTASRSKHHYFVWMKSYGYINHTVILYTDVHYLGIQFKKMRSNFPEHMTQVFVVQKSVFWAFQIQPKIDKIFKQEGYPKNYPETIYSGYSSAMHVKYELIEKVIKEKLVKTKHLAWIDLGYFRGKYEGITTLEVPKDLKYDHIGFGQKYRYNEKASARDIVYRAMVCLTGSLFIGRPEYLLLLVHDYRQAVEDMIEMNIMASDEQVLYYMYSHRTSCVVRVPVQLYYCFNRISWHNIVEIMIRKSQKQFRNETKLMNTLLYTYIS